MKRAYGTLFRVWILRNGLKPVVTKCLEPTALLHTILSSDFMQRVITSCYKMFPACGSFLPGNSL
jgi:hypothetical protein